MRRLTCRTLAVRFPQPRTAQEREYLLSWQADNLSEFLDRDDARLQGQADSRDEDRDSQAELGGPGQ